MPNLVLIADDDPGSMKLSFDLLTVLNCRVIQTLNGIQAVTEARSQLPDLILMDLQLPIMDGIEATKILKTEGLTRHIPVIAVAAYATKGDEELIRVAGFDGYLAKPINIQDVLRVAEEYLIVGAPGFAQGEEN